MDKLWLSWGFDNRSIKYVLFLQVLSKDYQVLGPTPTYFLFEECMAKFKLLSCSNDS